MNLSILVLLASAPQAIPAAPVVPDSELAEQRGGFRLPNGIDVALTVQSVTSINGSVVLNTVFRADQGPPSVSVYVPRPGEPVAAPAQTADTTAGGASGPTISYDMKGGLQVIPGNAAPRITLTAGGQGAAQSTDGLALVGDETPSSTDNGTVIQSQRDGLRSVVLKGTDLTVTHLAGNAFGSAIENSGSDRTIDTQTIVSLDLRNAGPDVLGSAMFRAGNVAIDALSTRGQ